MKEAWEADPYQQAGTRLCLAAKDMMQRWVNWTEGEEEGETKEGSANEVKCSVCIDVLQPRTWAAGVSARGG